ncbi:Predicted arabinose efflux permease, MFS family [Prauserella marina]|uniref:Predicted arabinose efflux permease, MFS family n=1 Tax=Prauserella marina TaxID=530584 RepID=A0A1G6LJQ2_9PSEU|nr:MFS transporter [Prauserella marina]PWV85873.1 putative MFS family arabinose efflux permease [Prauserella marina]SDC43404.1 Predicted arabinose efflux permease, MFS family [Prauserella marina]
MDLEKSGGARTTPRQWLAVAVLSSSTFVVVTSEMLPVGVLTPMSEGLDLAKGTVGSSLTITGIVTALTAPLVPRLLGGFDRRVVLAIAMIVLATGNALTALAQGFGTLLVSRVVLGVGMGAVWGLAAAVAARLVAPRNAALAVSFAVGGVAAASVAGVPLGTVVGTAFGWRTAFGTLAVGGVVLAAGLVLALPRLPRPATPVTGNQATTSLLRVPVVVTGLVITVALVTAHFAAYTYVRPFLEEQGRFGPTAIAVVLLGYGLFGLAGNFVAGATAARRPRPTLLSLAAGIGGAITLLAVFGSLQGITAAGIALWGLAYGGVSVAGQIWMTKAAPDRVEQITGSYVGAFTGSIALGAFLGGTLVESAGITPLLWSAAVLAFLSLAFGLLRPAQSRRNSGCVLHRNEPPSERVIEKSTYST